MPLYHFSEDPTIEIFVPRPPLAHAEQAPLVWAIDAWHQPMYFAPRDCPRGLFWPLPTTTKADLDRFWSYASDHQVLAIEAAWFERLRTTQVYRYVMPEDTFASLNDAGMHVSRQTVVPLRVEPLRPLLEEIFDAGVELRVCRSLVALADAVIDSTLHFSLIRMRNAQGSVDPAKR